MPHIHTEPDQNDITISAYIVLEEDGLQKCLVHYHKKIDTLMQIGGHIELNETPWQAVAHELEEESGFALSELQLVQHDAELITSKNNVYHPIPFMMNTHNVGNEHYHSDLAFAFIASERPKGNVGSRESVDLRWLTLNELKVAVEKDEALEDVFEVYTSLLSNLGTYVLVPADSFSLEKPTNQGLHYKRGAVEG